MSVNRVTLVGRLGRDPETRFTSEGKAVANTSLATDETFKDRSGERQKRTEWHSLVIWGKQAEIAQQYLKKGSLIYVEGRIQSRKWTDKEEQERIAYEIVVTNFKMLGGNPDGAKTTAAAAKPAAAGAAKKTGGFKGNNKPAAAAPAEEEGQEPTIDDEDIPF
jgi:single-strand DNA-binding protein